jgi:hypothetical protein
MSPFEPLRLILSELFKFCEDRSWDLPDTFRDGEVWWTRKRDGKKALYYRSADWRELKSNLANTLTNLNLPSDEYVLIGINSEGTLRMAIGKMSYYYDSTYAFGIKLLNDYEKLKMEVKAKYIYSESPLYIFKIERLNNHEKLIRVGENFK